MAAEPDALESPQPPPPAWVALVTWSALAIVVMVALQVIGIFMQGVTLDADLDLQYRIGFAFLDNLDKGPLGFELVLAILLVLAPVIARDATSSRHDVITQVVLTASAGLALLIVICGAFGIPTRVHLVHRESGGEVNATLWWVLITFTLRNVAPAVLALVAALAGVKARFQPRRTRPPEQ